MTFHFIVAYIFCLPFLFLDGQISYSSFLILVIIGCFIPDLDHFFYFYLYGRHQEYAQKVTTYISTGKLQQAIDFCRTHHKNNHCLVSHNLVVLSISLVMTIISVYFSSYQLTIFFTALTSHFVFDATEDVIFFGRLNPNWLLHYKKL